MIGNLCIRPEGGIDVAMYEGLHTGFSLDDAFRFEDIDHVSRSWRDAVHANAECQRRRDAEE